MVYILKNGFSIGNDKVKITLQRQHKSFLVIQKNTL
jgi:hypothetical protein